MTITQARGATDGSVANGQNRRGRGPRVPGRGRPSAAYLFVLPGLVVMTVVMLVPTIQAVNVSLHDWGVVAGSESRFVGLENYAHALTDPVFWRAAQNGAIYVLATVPLQIGLGLACALLLNARLPGRGAFRAVIYVPVISSWVIVSLLFRYLFGTDDGAVNAVISALTGDASGGVDWFGGRWTALVAICVLGIWKGVGWSMLIFLAGLQSVPVELHEAAAVDGAGWWRRVIAVDLPAIRRTIAYVTILLVIGAFNVFISVYLMTGGGPANLTQVPLTYLYQQAFSMLDFGYGSAIAFMLTAVVLAVSVGQLWLTGRRDGERRS